MLSSRHTKASNSALAGKDTSWCFDWAKASSVGLSGADPGFCEGGFEGGFVNSLKGTFEQK